MATIHRSADPQQPASVAAARFDVVRRGFDPDQVGALLQDVAAELAALIEREAQLRAELEHLRTNPVALSELDEDTLAQMMGHETLRVLQTARESAAQIKLRAEEGAARILRDAAAQADQLRAEANDTARDVRSRAAADAAAEVDEARRQGREMVDEARAYRERVLVEAARRREAAQAQIQRLLDGRDHLLATYERARQAAAMVIGDIDALSPQRQVSEPEPQEIQATEETEETQETQEPQEPEAVEVIEEVAEITEVAEVEEVIEEVVEVAEVVEVVEAEELTEPTEPTEPAPASSVDDLFARLRAARVEAEQVAEPAPEVAPEPAPEVAPDVASEPVPDPEPAARPDDAVVDPFTVRNLSLAPLIASASRHLKRVLADEQNVLLGALRTPADDPADLLSDADEHLARYRDAVTDQVADAARAGGRSLGGEPAEPLDLSGVYRTISDSLVDPLRRRLERALNEWAHDPDEAVRRVRAVYREVKTTQVTEAVTEAMLLAYGIGALAAVAPGTPLCWRVDPAGPPCPDAEDNSLAGAVAAGDEFPTGHRLAPAHVGCRCVLTPPQ